MTTINFYGMPFRVMKQPYVSDACRQCWFRDSPKPCPNEKGEPADHKLEGDALYCVNQDDDEEEAFFVLDTPEGHADYIAKKLEGT